LIILITLFNCYVDSGKRKKDTPEEKKSKADARKRRRIELASSSSGPVCKSCGQPGHTTSASSLCPNHEHTIKERLKMAFPTSYQLYTVSLTLKSFIRRDEGNPNKLLEYQERIIAQSSFLREVVYRAQLLVNYYILNNANNNVEYLSNDIFEKNFWYRVCRLIYGNIRIEELQNFYPRLPGIQEAYNRLQMLDNVDLSVEKQGLVGYGQIVSSACDTVATAYNNFYVENYETYVGNYFIFRLKQEYTVSNNKN
jgi:hypothetical protein